MLHTPNAVILSAPMRAYTPLFTEDGESRPNDPAAAAVAAVRIALGEIEGHCDPAPEPKRPLARYSKARHPGVDIADGQAHNDHDSDTSPMSAFGGLAACGAVARDRKSCRKSGARRLHVRLPLRGGGRMTAEIAVLNKYAVALAADSAVTISAGSKEEKIFDSGDKLFELCRGNPIGIMIYNGMDFSGVPLPVLIKRFRSEPRQFSTVREAAFAFLAYLDDFGKRSTQSTKDSQARRIIQPIVDRIKKIYTDRVEKELITAASPALNSLDDFRAATRNIMEDCVSLYERLLAEQNDAQFIGDGDLILDSSILEVIDDIAEQAVGASDIYRDLKDRFVNIGKMALIKDMPTETFTGLVVAGFGLDELFPTLISFEIDGMVVNRLKYAQKNYVDIDRGGPRSRVLPFAQKEMVERFLYGLDERIEDQVMRFCEESIPEISNSIADKLDFDDNSSKMLLREDADKAELAFLTGLKEKAFEAIRDQSKAEIEDMVEFMPKPELARMAEALVNLTSIKRRVSRGMETVGGPIDVAVISNAEGFVWIKRKHYFPSELNARYFERIKGEAQTRRSGDGE